MSLEVFEKLESKVQQAIDTITLLQMEIEELKEKNNSLAQEVQNAQHGREELERENNQLREQQNGWQDRLQALNAGARGFLSKRCSPDELIAAVRTVAAGGCYLTPDIAIKLAAGRQDPLTRRERQVAEKLAQGMSVKEIAAELDLSPKTVHVHRANLMEKLNVSNDVELARRMFDSWQ